MSVSNQGGHDTPQFARELRIDTNVGSRQPSGPASRAQPSVFPAVLSNVVVLAAQQGGQPGGSTAARHVPLPPTPPTPLPPETPPALTRAHSENLPRNNPPRVVRVVPRPAAGT